MIRKRAWIVIAAVLVPSEKWLRPTHGFVLMDPTRSSSPVHLRCPPSQSALSLGAKPSHDDDDDDDDEDDIALQDDDWRSFRAKLVMGEKATPSTPAKPASAPVLEDDFDGIGALFAESSTATSSTGSSSTSTTSTETSTPSSTSREVQGMTPLDPSQWAYDSGKVIEQGAVILGGVEQDFGFGLRQQYFHKAAILVLEHDTTFTKGIILNRPTDLLLEDETNPGVKWRIWFGGDVQGIESNNPAIVCLHSMKSERAIQASRPVMKDIQWTTFENANKLVKAGNASPSDFWVFVGYAGWAPGQLMGELERSSWYMVATDSQTLLKELARQGAGADPRDAGLETWDLLMNMIGRRETAQEYSGGFDDLMLKEWALKHLLSTEAGGGAGVKTRPPDGLPPVAEKDQVKTVMRLFRGKTSFQVGSLLRASSADRSPFLLDHQELHKSIILVLADDENLTVGAILNRPVARGLDISISEKVSGKSQRIVLPLRYGGQFAVKGSEALLWLHCNPALRLARIGSPVGTNEDGIWKCTSDDIVSAITKGLATPEEFFVITGVSVWTKTGITQGIEGEIENGSYEVIPDRNIPTVWKSLCQQEVLSESNLLRNLSAGEEAWRRGGEGLPSSSKNGDEDMRPIAGLGEGFDEEDDSLVFKSDVKVSNLSDDALKSWVSAFLLPGVLSSEDE